MRLIDADALVAAYDAAHDGPPGKARTLILNAPTVCCGTCKHYMPLNKSGLGLCSWGDIDVYGDWICQDWNVEE